MTAPIAVDPAALAGTGATVASEGDAAAGAVGTLSSALSGAGALFGHDAAGLVFGQSYTQAGQSLLDAAASAVTACGTVGFGVQMSASNYGQANAASTVGGGQSPVPAPVKPSDFAAPGMPPPLEGGIAAPLGWSLVESFVGDFWPDGDPAKMHAAAAAWRAFGTAMSAAAAPVAGAGATLGAQQIPEAGQMADAAAQIGSGFTDIAAQAQALAAQVDSFAATVAATQDAIRGLLHQLSPAGVLETTGGIFSGHNPWDKIKEIAGEIKTVLDNMKREADASRTLFSQGMNALDSATNSLESWAHKEFVEAFGADVGNVLSSDFNALVDLPEGGFKFLAQTAEGLQQLDPTRFAYDPQGALDTWKGLAESAAVVTNPALLAEKVISDPQGSLNTVKGLVDWEDVENGHPFRALGYNTAQVGTFLIPGAGEAAPAVDAASTEARVAGAEARIAGTGTRDAAATAATRAASATEGVTAKASQIGTKLDGIKVPEAEAGTGLSGRAPVEPPKVPEGPAGHAPVGAEPPRVESTVPPGDPPIHEPPTHAAPQAQGTPMAAAPHTSASPSTLTTHPLDGPVAPKALEDSCGSHPTPTESSVKANRESSSAEPHAADGGRPAVTPSAHQPEPPSTYTHTLGEYAHPSTQEPMVTGHATDLPSAHGSDSNSHTAAHHGAGEPDSRLAPAVDHRQDPTHPNAAEGDGWHHVNDSPGDPHYGEPLPEHWESGDYPTPNDTNQTTFGLVEHPEEPYGHDSGGNPLAKEDYDARYNKIGPEGQHWQNYPPNDGAVEGTRRLYTSGDAYMRDHGTFLDRVGNDKGAYLGVMPDGVPPSFEGRGLPTSSLNSPYSAFTFLQLPEGWSIEVSQIAPAFGRDGGALQVLFYDESGEKVAVRMLLKDGVLG